MNQVMGVWFAILSVMAFGETAPPGFEKPGLIGKLKAGAIDLQTPIDTPSEIYYVYKSFFPGVLPEKYIELVTDHPRYPEVFSEVRQGRTLSKDLVLMLFEWELHLAINELGLFFEALPQGMQKVLVPESPSIEWKIENEVRNYSEDLLFARQWVRLIPYEGGILVEDTFHLAPRLEQLNFLMRAKLRQEGTRIQKGWRRALTGGFEDAFMLNLEPWFGSRFPRQTDPRKATWHTD